MTTTRQPSKRFTLGSITVLLWADKDRHGRRFYTTTVTRSVQQRSGKWDETAPLRPCDMPAVEQLTARAREWMTANPILPERGPPVGTPTVQADRTEAALESLCAFIEHKFSR